MCALQNYFIFPGSATQGQPDARLPAGLNYQLLALHARDGTPIVAIFGEALQPDGQPLPAANLSPTIIYFYGNGACMAYSTDVFDNLRRIGCNVIIADFEGYGMSGGKPSEAGCYATADAEYDYLLARSDIDPAKIVPMGWSLGAAAAIDLASRRPASALITVSAFTDMPSLARRFFPWLPTSLILNYRFDNLAKIRRISCPILLVHGLKDDLIPPPMAGKLAAVAAGKVTRLSLPEAAHNDVFDVGGRTLWNELSRFLAPISH